MLCQKSILSLELRKVLTYCSNLLPLFLTMLPLLSFLAASSTEKHPKAVVCEGRPVPSSSTSSGGHPVVQSSSEACHNTVASKSCPVVFKTRPVPPRSERLPIATTFDKAQVAVIPTLTECKHLFTGCLWVGCLVCLYITFYIKVKVSSQDSRKMIIFCIFQSLLAQQVKGNLCTRNDVSTRPLPRSARPKSAWSQSPLLSSTSPPPTLSRVTHQPHPLSNSVRESLQSI